VNVATTHSVDVKADEIYAHSAFGVEFVSMVGEQAVHGIWGFAKDFGLSGLKVGVLHTRDPDVRTAARALAYFAPVSTHTQALVTNLLSDAGWVAEFLAENRRRLRASATAAMDLLAAGSIGYLERTSGFSLWIDLRPYLPTVSAAAEHALWQRILRSARVNILPGTAFACPEPGWFRLCHATDASTVATGINRLTRALETS
jgi:1-aminocyclopropane-1-carboxylate synthase 1/2/6